MNLHIGIGLEGAVVLVDPGYPLSYVSKSYITELIPNFNQLGVSVVTIGLRLPGLATRVFHLFHVIENLQVKLLIGNDFMLKHQCVLDFGNQTLSLQGHTFPLVPSSDSPSEN